MAYDQIHIKGATSQSIEVFLRDSTTGQGKTGLAAASVTAYYIREGAAANASMTLAAMTLGTWLTLGWVEIDATHQPGLYQFGMPNAALASGANAATFTFTATGVIGKSTRVLLIDANLRDSVRLGLTALPNVTAGATSGLPLSVDGSGRVDVLSINGTAQTARDLGASVLVSVGLGAGQINVSAGKVPATLLSSDVSGNIPTDLQTVKSQTVTCAAGVTVLASVGTAATSTAQTGDAFSRIGFTGAGLTGIGDTRLSYLDAFVSSRLAPGGTLALVTSLTNAPTTGDLTATMKTSVTTAATAATPIAASVTGAVGSVTAGVTLTAGAIQAIWDALTSALTTVGSIGKLLVTNLDAAITSRTKPADTQAAVTLVGTLTTYTGNTPQTGDAFTRLGAAGAGLTALGDTRIANLDATVSSRNATTPPTAAAIRTEMDSNSTKLANLDAAVSGVAAAVWAVGTRTLSSFGTLVADIATGVWAATTRTLSAFGFTVAPTASQNAIAVVDQALSGHTTAGTVGAGISAASAPSAATVAAAVWDVSMAAHVSAGSTGASLNGAGAAGDPWTAALPAAYGAGTAGKIVGDNLNATVGSRLATAGYTAPDNSSVTAIKARTDLIPAAPAAVADIPTAAANADKLLGRNLAGGSDGGRSVKDALRVSRNKVVISGTTITVYAEDDTTPAWTGVLTLNAGASPITGVDPA